MADQLQTNYASDLRHILKTVFECNTSSVVDKSPDASPKIQETQNDDADFRDRIDDVSLTDEESSESQTATGDFPRPAQNFRNRQRSTIDSSGLCISYSISALITNLMLQMSARRMFIVCFI